MTAYAPTNEEKHVSPALHGHFKANDPQTFGLLISEMTLCLLDNRISDGPTIGLSNVNSCTQVQVRGPMWEDLLYVKLSLVAASYKRGSDSRPPRPLLKSSVYLCDLQGSSLQLVLWLSVYFCLAYLCLTDKPSLAAATCQLQRRSDCYGWVCTCMPYRCHQPQWSDPHPLL